MKTLGSIDFSSFGRKYLERLKTLITHADVDAIGRLIRICEQARLAGNVIYFIGNGGSAATASHFASDFLGANVKCGLNPPYRAVSLCDNTAVLTAFGNDFGYGRVFLHQLQSLMSGGDIVVAISASGNSPNLIEAVEWANQNGGRTFALVGFDGGRLKNLAADCFHCPTGKGEYGPVEDVHLIVHHMINLFVLESMQRLTVLAPE